MVESTRVVPRILIVTVLVLVVTPGGNGLTEAERAKFLTRPVTGKTTGTIGTVTLTVEGGSLRLRSNSIPDHVTGTFPASSNPNAIKEQSVDVSIPNSPQIAKQASCLPGGPIAFARNGVAMFNPYTHLGKNAVEGPDAEVFDLCEGHPDQSGTYHYHHTPACLHAGERDELVGIALDGYPIYGSLDADSKELTSADLDNCHGHTVDGQYRYRLTKDFPYIMGCYKGVVGSSVSSRQGKNCYFTDGSGNSNARRYHGSIIVMLVMMSLLVLMF